MSLVSKRLQVCIKIGSGTHGSKHAPFLEDIAGINFNISIHLFLIFILFYLYNFQLIYMRYGGFIEFCFCLENIVTFCQSGCRSISNVFPWSWSVSNTQNNAFTVSSVWNQRQCETYRDILRWWISVFEIIFLTLNLFLYQSKKKFTVLHIIRFCLLIHMNLIIYLLISVSRLQSNPTITHHHPQMAESTNYIINIACMTLKKKNTR